MSDIQIFLLIHVVAGRSAVTDALIVFFAVYFPLILITLFPALIFLTHRGQRQISALFWTGMASAIFARFGIVSVIRFFYQRPRPFLAHQVAQLVADNAPSFPSGHAAFFFALSTAVYCYKRSWGTWFFVGSFVIAISRVAAGVHYPSDIAAGALIGVIVGYAMYRIAARGRTAHEQHIHRQV